MNDANQNLKYPTLDRSIETTYAARSAATNKNSLYDSYIRAFRWASNRIGDTGVIAYVSNGGWIDANTTDGMRKTLAEEFDHIYIYNLRGNQRTAGELSRREGGKIFGAGSRNTVAITLLVKTGETGASPAHIHYCDIGDYLDRDQKLALIDTADLDTLDWHTITPNTDGDWLNQRSDDFLRLIALGDKRDRESVTAFGNYSKGLSTARDAWLYCSTPEQVASNVERMLRFYNSQALAYQEALVTNPRLGVNEFVDKDPIKISWNTNDFRDLEKGSLRDERPRLIVQAAYRPFFRQWVAFDGVLNERRYQLGNILPTPLTPNHGFYVVGMGSAVPFSLLMTDLVPDLHVTGAGSGGQFFPRYTYMDPTPASGQFSLDDDPSDLVDGYQWIDNITDNILTAFQATAPAATKDGIFHYVYGLLHSPDYRTRFAADLKKMLPRIPLPTHATMYDSFRKAGEKLAALHLGYETVEPYLLTEDWQRPPDTDTDYRVTKMTFAKKAGETDRTRITYNSLLTLTGIPDDAYRYQLGSRSAIEWIIDRYQIRTDKASGITNDPNTYSDNPCYIIDLLKRIVTVSMETMRIVDELPGLAP